MISRSIPYGLWPSLLAPERMAATLRITDVQWDPSGRARIWREERSGHGVLTLQKDEDAPRDLTEIEPVRARIGYGGGDFSTGRDIVIYAGEDGRLYRLPPHTSRQIHIVDAIAHTELGLYIPRTGRIRLKLATQVADGYSKQMHVVLITRPPDRS